MSDGLMFRSSTCDDPRGALDFGTDVRANLRSCPATVVQPLQYSAWSHTQYASHDGYPAVISPPTALTFFSPMFHSPPPLFNAPSSVSFPSRKFFNFDPRFLQVG